MPSTLVPVHEAMDYLGEEDAQVIPIVERLIDQVEALFLAHANRRERPFQAAQTARVEVHDGTGTATLWLDYPLAALTAVKIGADSTAPDETLTVADLTVLRYGIGGRRLQRVDGGCFGTAGDPRVVHVTYNAQADLPQTAAVAILRAVAAIYRQRGAEGSASERVGGFAADLSDWTKEDATWRDAVAAHWEPHVG